MKRKAKRADQRELFTEQADALIRKIVLLQAKVRRYYELADDALMELIALVDPGYKLKLRDGRVATFVDNFADRNVTFRTTAMRRYSVEVKKR
jgi:hypothetical protein